MSFNVHVGDPNKVLKNWGGGYKDPYPSVDIKRLTKRLSDLSTRIKSSAGAKVVRSGVTPLQRLAILELKRSLVVSKLESYGYVVPESRR